MAGYIGSKASVTQVDGYTTTEADAEFVNDPNDAITVDSSGNVGIGTSSPSFETGGGLEVNYSAGLGSHIKLTDSASGSGGSNGFDLYAYNTSGYIENYEAGSIVFRNGGTERARIDSSGNLLVGKTSSSFSTAGARLSSTDNQFVTDGQLSAAFNRKTSDGDIIGFFKDNSTVGSIGAYSSRSFIGSGSVGLFFDNLSQTAIRPFSTSALGTIDNHIDLGSSANRFDDIYATNGSIQTSDQNEKQQIASLTTAEMDAAKAISQLFKTFKWNDSVADKGDAARTHAGVIAQEVETAMTDAGLDAGDYAFFTSNTWWETQTDVPAVAADPANGVEAKDAYTRTDTYETQADAPAGATERTRKGIRYPELLSFVGAATEQRLADIETRLTALEAV